MGRRHTHALVGLACWAALELIGAPRAHADSSGLLARLEAAKSVRVGIANQPPFSSLNPDGSITGVAPSVTQAVLAPLGIKHIEGVIATYGQLIPGMLAGRWDFVSASLTITKARCAQVQFSDPIVFDGDAIVGKPGTKPPTRLAELGALNAPIGVEAGGADLRAVLASGVSPSNVRQFPNDPAMMDGLLAGRETYFVIAHSALLSVLRRRDVKIAVSYPLADYAPHASAVAFRKQDADLFAAYQANLRKLKASDAYLNILSKFGYDVLPSEIHMTIAQACAIAR